jgi:hypothetical protein
MLKSLYDLTSPELDRMFEEVSEFLHNRFDILKTKTMVKTSQTTLSEYQLHSSSSPSLASTPTSAARLSSTTSLGVGLVSEEEIPVDAKVGEHSL